MDRGERERYDKLSGLAKQVISQLLAHAKQGSDQVSLNELRDWLANRSPSDGHPIWYSRQLLAALMELQQRSYGRLHGTTDANPVFILDLPQLQSLSQSGLF